VVVVSTGSFVYASMGDTNAINTESGGTSESSSTGTATTNPPARAREPGNPQSVSGRDPYPWAGW
jgi:hypothetical protein